MHHLEAVISDGVDRRARSTAPTRTPGVADRRLLDGLAVQVTVHDKAVTLDELRAWVLVAAAAEVGVDPSQFDR